MAPVYGLFPIGLDRAERYLYVSAHGRIRTIQHLAAQPDGHHAGPSPAVATHRLLLGAFFEGAAGFGTPVAVTAALLIGLGFKPLQASGLSLIANTAPVAFGALGTTDHRSRESHRFQRDYAGRDGRKNSDALLHSGTFLAGVRVCGLGRDDRSMACDRGRRGFVRDSATAHIELAWAVDSQCDRSVVSMACLIGFLFIWHPKRVWTFEGEANKTDHQPITASPVLKSPEHGCRGSS